MVDTIIHRNDRGDSNDGNGGNKCNVYSATRYIATERDFVLHD